MVLQKLHNFISPSLFFSCQCNSNNILQLLLKEHTHTKKKQTKLTNQPTKQNNKKKNRPTMKHSGLSHEPMDFLCCQATENLFLQLFPPIEARFYQENCSTTCSLSLLSFSFRWECHVTLTCYETVFLIDSLKSNILINHPFPGMVITLIRCLTKVDMTSQVTCLALL